MHVSDIARDTEGFPNSLRPSQVRPCFHFADERSLARVGRPMTRTRLMRNKLTCTLQSCHRAQRLSLAFCTFEIAHSTRLIAIIFRGFTGGRRGGCVSGVQLGLDLWSRCCNVRGEVSQLFRVGGRRSKCLPEWTRVERKKRQRRLYRRNMMMLDCTVSVVRV